MIDVEQLDWGKGNGLLPAIIQDAHDFRVLMLGYMNVESLEQTLATKRVTFFSRSKQVLWVKGETSGHYLDFVSADIDCDNDTLLIRALPQGPVCHTGSPTCFGDEAASDILFLETLSALIHTRNVERPDGSYTTELFTAGKSRIAQKVGEEGVELALARMKDDTDEMVNEAADLLYHMMILLEDAELSMKDVCAELSRRHQA